MDKFSEFIENLTSSKELETLTAIKILYKDNKNQWQHYGKSLEADGDNRVSDIKHIHFTAFNDNKSIESKLTYMISKNAYLIENQEGFSSEVKEDELYRVFKKSIATQLN